MAKNKKYYMSSKRWSELFAKRGTSYITHVELYYKDKDTIITEHKLNTFGKCSMIFLSPILFLLNFIIYGTSGVKEFAKFISDCYKDKPFSQDVIYPRHEKHWSEIRNIVGDYEDCNRK